MLTPPVQSMLQQTSTELIEWRCQPITGGTGEGVGLWRVAGTARRQDEIADWSLVLKIIGPQASGATLGDWNYWRREACVYESDLLTHLPPDLTAVHCYQVVEQPDGTVWLWLADLGPQDESKWSATTYWQAGRALGQFNGAYLNGKPLPDQPWISRRWLHQWLDRAPGMSQLAMLADQRRVQRLYPPDVWQGYQTLWNRRLSLLAVADRLPQTFCHRDAFPMNLLLRNDKNNSAHFTAIDWAYAGIGAIGEEVAALVFAEVTLLRQIPLSVAQENGAAAIAGYLQGLRDTGWQGNEDLVYCGYLIAALLRFGVGMVAVSLNIVTNPTVDEWAEAAYGYPLDDMIEYWVDVARWRLQLAEELYQLLG